MGKNSQQQKPNQFIIVVIIGVVISALYIGNYMMSQNQEKNNRNIVPQATNQKANQDSQFKTVGKDAPGNTAGKVVKQDTGSIDERVMQVARNFRCACGGCGELQLATCQCDMPSGAEEERAFIRYNLKDGLTVDQVIEMVDNKYGHRNT